MDNSNKIEAFLDGQMSDIEGQQFLESLNSDSVLKKEFNFQSEIIEGIKEFRKAEIIARLNKVNVSANNWHSTAHKAIMGIVAVAVIGWGIYATIDSSNTVTDNKVTTKNNIEKTESSTITEATPQTSTTIEKGGEKITENAIPLPVLKPKESLSNKNETSTTFSVPKVVDNFSDESSLQKEENLDVPSSTVLPTNKSFADLAVEVKTTKKYNFHYQMSDGKLLLYGDFDEDLFELIEVNASEQIKLFLFYNNNFYSIETSSTEINALVAITSVEIIKKLNSVKDK